MCLWKTWEQAPLPRSLVPFTLRGYLEVRWIHKNVTHCASPFGCFWLLCRVYLFCLFVGLLHLMLSQKWFKAGMEVGSDTFWDSVGRVLLSCDMDIHKGHTNAVASVSAHFPRGQFCWSSYSWDFLRVFHKSWASTISNEIWGWFYYKESLWGSP